MPESLENATLDEVLDHVGPGKLIRSDVFTWMLERIRDLEDRVGDDTSTGRVEVPNFVGLALGPALDALNQRDVMLQRGPAMDVTGQILNPNDAGNRARIVVGHSPEAGRRVSSGSAVRFLVAAPLNSGGGGNGGQVPPVITDIQPSEQNIGDVVTISGDNFLGTTVTVAIDEQDASIDRLTDIAIDARIPETVTEPPDGETRIVPVTVTVDGTSVTDSDTLAVRPLPPEPQPVIVSVNPSTASVGDTVVISGNNFTDDVSAVDVIFTFASSDIQADVRAARTSATEPDEIEITVPNIGVDFFTIVPFRVVIEGAPTSSPFSALGIRPSNA